MIAGNWSVALRKLHLMLEAVSGVSYCQITFCHPLGNEYEDDVT